MAHRYKHTVDIVWLTEDLTIVTKWKTRMVDGKRVPAELATGAAGMAFVTVTAGRKQERMFLTPNEVHERFEHDDDEVAEDAPKHKRFSAAPDHVAAQDAYKYPSYDSLHGGVYRWPPEAHKAL